MNVAVLLFLAAIGLTVLLAFYGVLLAEHANRRIDAVGARVDDHWDDNRPLFEETR